MRVGRPSYLATQAYLLALAVGSIGTAIWIARFFEARGGYGQVLSRAGDVGLKGMLLVCSPILLAAAAAAGITLVFLLRRPRPWALALGMLAAPAALGAAYVGHRILLSVERGFYDKSRYTALYRKGAYPLLALTAIYIAVVALDILVLSRGRSAPAAALPAAAPPAAAPPAAAPPARPPDDPA